MNRARVKEVEAEIKRLQARINELWKTEVTYASAEPGFDAEYRYFSHRESGAVRRASMDLTRALAKMRKHD